MNTSEIIYMLLPLIILQLALMIFALRDLIKREKVTGGNKIIWGAIIILINIIGPIIYFVLGRKEN